MGGCTGRSHRIGYSAIVGSIDFHKTTFSNAFARHRPGGYRDFLDQFLAMIEEEMPLIERVLEWFDKAFVAATPYQE